MLYRKMPKSGDMLSILGFGAMRLPQKGNKIDEPRATAQIRMAVDRGINYIDAAMPYHAGACEPFLGRALADGYREKVRLATKLPPWDVQQQQDMDHLLAAQLQYLNTSCIDYYLLHSLTLDDWDRLKGLGVIDFLNRAKKEKKIGNAGFSFHSSYDEFRQIVDAYAWDFCQIQYNYLDEQYQAGTRGLQYAAQKGLGVVIMEPLRGGSLTKKMPPEIEAVFNEADVKRTPAAWGLRWVWNHPEVITVLSGMNEEAHIEENLRIADEALPGSLTEQELAIIKKAEKKFRQLVKVGCTGCMYCMPCPEGVVIPACFDAYNTAHGLGTRGEGFFKYLLMAGRPLGGKEPGFASQCAGCGQCEGRCPQKLPIRQHLKAVAGEFEGVRLKLMLLLIKVFMFFKRRKHLKKGASTA